MTHAGGSGKSYDVDQFTKSTLGFMYERDWSSADQASELLKDSLPAPNYVLASLPLHVYSSWWKAVLNITDTFPSQ